MSVIVGPCRCQGCRFLVVYMTDRRWHDFDTFGLHDCGGLPPGRPVSLWDRVRIVAARRIGRPLPGSVG
jgi:hypothetical protein